MTPDDGDRQGPDAPLAHRRPGYPSSGCVPAVPDSVLPVVPAYRCPTGLPPQSDCRRLDKAALRALLEGFKQPSPSHTERRHDSRQQFTNQWQSEVSFQLSCFDRVILTGYLPFWGADCVNKWICGRLGILHKNFLPQMKGLSDELVESAKRQAAQARAPFRHLQGHCRKDKLIDEIARNGGSRRA